MFGNIRMTGFVVALSCALWAAAAVAQTPAACPWNATWLAEGTKLRCTCEAGAAGSAFGSVRYTADSSICQAAVHAGKPPGPIDLIVGGACPAFPGSAANGVTTSNWASFDKSFSFGDSLPPCPAVAAAPPPPASAPAAATVANCPSFITQSDMNKPGKSLTCVCDKALDLQVGVAYGVDRYSDDSAICVAARHAGKLLEPGGTVTVYAAEGCGNLEGSQRNGITTKSWRASVPGTISFVTPAPACAAPPRRPRRRPPRHARPHPPTNTSRSSTSRRSRPSPRSDPAPAWAA